MEIKTIEVFGFNSALRALRLPHKTISDSPEGMNCLDRYYDKDNREFVEIKQTIYIGPKDLKLMQALILQGDDHAKCIRGIIASAEINAPRYFWAEADTYSIGKTSLGSESTMHCEAKGLTGKELQKMKSDLKEGHHQKRVIEYSYQTLRRINFQRELHRLPEWKIIRDWIKTLPFAEELILIQKEKKKT